MKKRFEIAIYKIDSTTGLVQWLCAIRRYELGFSDVFEAEKMAKKLVGENEAYSISVGAGFLY